MKFDTIVYNKVKAEFYDGPQPLSSLPLNMDDGKKVTLSGTVLEERNDMFTLVRYSIKDDIKVPNFNPGPTLSISLFMPNDKLPPEVGIQDWAKRYLSNQLKLCSIFNYYFPDGNYRNYFDSYMINKFAQMRGMMHL